MDNEYKKNKKINTSQTFILGIETSCDETAAAVVADGREVLSNIIASSSEYQARFGGVVPEIAARKHVENISQVVDMALAKAELSLKDISAIAATAGPGLIGSLLVGLNYGKALSYGQGLPFIAVNHIDGHIASAYLNTDFSPPFICLMVSGGHTALVKVKGYNQHICLGATRDDAVGEAYDKIAGLLGLNYPGGPLLDKMAQKGEINIDFPKAMLGGSLDFSFSGLKSSVINYLNTAKMKNKDINPANVASSFQYAAIDVLVHKTKKALQQTGLKKLAIAGGVACNSLLRKEMKTYAREQNIELQIPEPILCTDNGAMIAAAGYIDFINKQFSQLNVNAYSNLQHRF